MCIIDIFMYVCDYGRSLVVHGILLNCQQFLPWKAEKVQCGHGSPLCTDCVSIYNYMQNALNNLASYIGANVYKHTDYALKF